MDNGASVEDNSSGDRRQDLADNGSRRASRDRSRQMDATRIVIVDDEPLFRDLLRRTLTRESGFEVVGIAEDGEAAIRVAREVKPDAILMDIELGGELNGIEAALRIKEESPKMGIVILSAHSDRRYITSLPLEASRGWAYLLKQTVPDLATVVRAVEGSRAGMVVLDPAVLAGLRPRRGSVVAALTPRQQEVLGLLAEGCDNATIAERLSLSEKSVETYINAIYQGLHLSNEPGIHARVRATLLYLESAQSGK
ncbi:MAG: response regulator transcription factor [Chloroflexi bacterium]|nr:response regulator transcription factor [Chloroflexota bacterium]